MSTNLALMAALEALMTRYTLANPSDHAGVEMTAAAKALAQAKGESAQPSPEAHAAGHLRVMQREGGGLMIVAPDGAFPSGVPRHREVCSLPGRFDAEQAVRAAADAARIVDSVNALAGVPEATLQKAIQKAGGEPWRLLPEDLYTHLGDWRAACIEARENARDHDKAYWDHQLRTLDAVELAVDGRITPALEPEPEDEAEAMKP